MSIYYNQIGYLPKDKKIAVMTCKGMFYVYNKKDKKILEKKSTYFGLDESAKEELWLLDFSEFEEEGDYYLLNESGEKTSYFKIQNDVYTEVKNDLMKAFYYQRCGCDLLEKEAGIFKRKACHPKKALLYTDESKELDITGGWHDAGDYGKYVTAAATALGHLLYAYLLFPNQFKTSNLLEECKYEIDWLFKMQADNGSVYHKVTSMRHANFVMPHEDDRQFIVFPISTMATGAFAGIMALVHKIYEHVDAELAIKSLAASEKAWEWLEKNLDFIGFENPKDCNTGAYDDYCDTDERMWAAAELWKSTKQEKYLNALERYMDITPNKTAFGWKDVGGFAGLAMLFANQFTNKKEDAIKQCFYKEFLKEAERICEIVEMGGYKVALTKDEYTWGSNMEVIIRGMQLFIAYLLSDNETYNDYAKEQFHYILGKNALGISYITGSGCHSFKNPHNRVTVADGIEETIPGFLSGGPNNYPVDEKAEWLLLPGTAPMKSYFDIWECYSLNEITIYWNSCAVFLSAIF